MLPSSSDIQFPTPLQCLFEPKRFKVLWGGRGAGRSWGVARALLLLGTSRPLRILCVRELQNSIAESVHKVLSDQIEAMGLSAFYRVEKAKIYGQNGTEFSFEGIKNNTNKIKSYEGIDYCWVEEAVTVSRNSWGVLIPTIRKEDSEIWITFNPELRTDYTFKRFVKEANLDASVVVKMTHADNPWFPQVLRDEMERDKLRDYDHYLNIWEGHCREMLEGAIYAKELRMAQEEGRICSVGWERSIPVNTAWDLGRADKTSIWFFQRVALQTRILSYFEGSQQDITFFIKELQRRSYLYGSHFLPHDAKAKRLGSKLTIEEMLRTSYPRGVYIVPRLSVTDGINAARLVFPNCYFDEEGCEDGLNALRHYRYRVVDGHLSNDPLHDWASDASDAFRYLAVSLRQPSTSRDDIISRLSRAGRRVLPRGRSLEPNLSWMGR